MGDPDIDGSDPTFTDQQLEDLFDLHEEDANAAAADGWRIKAGSVAEWYHSSIDGASLSRQQVWDHCMRMAKMYDDNSAGALFSVRMEIDEETGAQGVEEFS